MIHLLKILIIIISLITVITCKENDKSPVEQEAVAQNKFKTRKFTLFAPKNIESHSSVPLLFVFHGAFGNGLSMQQATGFNEYASQNNFIVCYPDAATENWEEGCMCNKPYRLGIDDIGYINFLIDSLGSRFNIDSNRIFAAGYSQGGLFAQNIACKLSNRFAAVAAVASPMSVQLFQSCMPSNNISIIMIHGTNDPTLPFYGSDAGSFSLASSTEVIKLWSKLNNCNSEVKSEILPDGGDPNLSVIKWTYSGCSNNNISVLYEVRGGGHNWFKSPDLNTTNTIVDFFMNINRKKPSL